jgi:hypothetical protein
MRFGVYGSGRTTGVAFSGRNAYASKGAWRGVMVLLLCLYAVLRTLDISGVFLDGNGYDERNNDKQQRMGGNGSWKIHPSDY